MLKVAQLETLAELQQTEIGIQAEKIEKLEKHLGMEPSDSGASMAQKTSEKSMQLVQATLKRVVEKHARQRDTRQYHPAAHRQQPEAEGEVESEESEELEEDPGREGPAMLQSRAKGFPGVFKKAWDETGGKAVDGLKRRGAAEESELNPEPLNPAPRVTSSPPASPP
ncbi:unnamed protein product [Symbiodinium natans]|uniref:Uncharacterized protein n=1 Tax=Symbiodinium natans TaxID=878477 RepID=A0A812SNG6_9DINO|nr:unnamed protein product [Symbiodinium natans]